MPPEQFRIGRMECLFCDENQAVVKPTRNGKWTVFCHVCGTRAFFSHEVYQTLDVRKEVTKAPAKVAPFPFA